MVGKFEPKRLIRKVKKFAWKKLRQFGVRYSEPIGDIIEFPFKLVTSPLLLAFDIAGSAPRGFGVPHLISKLSFASIFAVAALGTFDVAINLGMKAICQRHCRTCNGWLAMQCTMCRGSGQVRYQVRNYSLRRGEKATSESVAEAIVDNRAELVQLPATVDFHAPLPFKECSSCDGTGVISCPECKQRINVRISLDNLMEPPWKPYNVFKKMHYPYEHIVESMKDPSIAAFWLFSLPQLIGGFKYDDDVKQKIWWQYKESMRYDQLRDVVAQRKPGWEYLQQGLITLDPARAREDSVVVKNVPYLKARKALEAEVMKLDPPPRPQNWGKLDLPLNPSSWSEQDLKDPTKFYEMTVLLNAQREIADKIFDAQWETKWREQKLNEMLEEKLKPYVGKIEDSVLSQPIILQPREQDKKREPKRERKRWWFF